VFEVRLPPEAKKAAKKRGKEQQCVFAQTQSITTEEVPSTITQNLRIRDSLAGPENNQLRNIILVGYSVREYMRILRLLNIDLARIGLIPTIIDTYLMA
jgi:hypothetical protein